MAGAVRVLQAYLDGVEGLAGESALRAAAFTRRVLPRFVVRLVPGFAALRVVLIAVSALWSVTVSVAVFAVPAAAAGAALGGHLLELVLQVWTASSNPGLCEPQTVVVSPAGVASVSSGGPARSAAGAAEEGRGADIVHVRWPLRSQADPSGRHLRRDGSPARVALFHRFDPFTANCIGAGNAVGFAALQVVWAVNANVLLVSTFLGWSIADGPGEALVLGLGMVVALAQAVFVTGRLVRLLAFLRRNVTPHEAAHARRIVYMQGPGGTRSRPFDRGSWLPNALEALGAPLQGVGRDWRGDPCFSVAELPSHPLRPVLIAKMRELHARAAKDGAEALPPQQRLALALAGLELPEALEPAPPLAAPPAVEEAAAPQAALTPPRSSAKPSAVERERSAAAAKGSVAAEGSA